MQIDVVTERRLYSPWNGVVPSNETRLRIDYVSPSSGIIPVKRVLNRLHQFLGENGYNEVCPALPLPFYRIATFSFIAVSLEAYEYEFECTSMSRQRALQRERNLLVLQLEFVCAGVCGSSEL